MKDKRRPVVIVALVLSLCISAPGGADDGPVDPAAKMLLERMGAVLAATEDFTLTNTFT